MAKSNAGRPTVMTETTLGKLEEAFAYDATIEEACFYADINPDTYYRYVKEHPEFSERVKALRQRPILKARQTVVAALNDAKNAQWYLERKVKAEFSPRSEIEHSGGADPVKVLLDKYGVTEEKENDRQNDEPVQGSSKSTT